MKYVINSQEHPIGKVKDFFYGVEFKIRGSCHYLVTAYFFWIENIPQDISCDTRDVLVQYHAVSAFRILSVRAESVGTTGASRFNKTSLLVYSHVGRQSDKWVSAYFVT